VLRLTETKRASAEVVLKAEGQLVDEWVNLLKQECQRLLAGDDRVLLDLADVNYADSRGVQALRELAQSPLAIINCTPLVQELLAEEAL
jgi:anti-anti-sigma regulatory factor